MNWGSDVPLAEFDRVVVEDGLVVGLDFHEECEDDEYGDKRKKLNECIAFDLQQLSPLSSSLKRLNLRYCRNVKGEPVCVWSVEQ